MTPSDNLLDGSRSHQYGRLRSAQSLIGVNTHDPATNSFARYHMRATHRYRSLLFLCAILLTLLSGTATEHSQRDSPIKTERITGEMLEQAGATHVGQSLHDVPEVQLRR